jgi:hypothetical protein
VVRYRKFVIKMFKINTFSNPVDIKYQIRVEREWLACEVANLLDNVCRFWALNHEVMMDKVKGNFSGLLR